MNLISLFALAMAVQTPAPETDQQPAEPVITSFDQLPIEEATALRCGVAFAVVQGWQESGDPRGGEWPDMAEQGGREFFVWAAVKLMDDRGIERSDFGKLAQAEAAKMRENNGAPAIAIMPACLLLLEAQRG